MALPFPLVTPSSEEKVPSPQVWGFPPGGDRMWYSTNPKSCLSKLPTLHPHGFKVQSSRARDGDLCETPPNFTPGKRGGRAPGVRNFLEVSTEGLVLLSRLELQAWLGTSYAGHWPRFSSGVRPE